MDLDWIFDWQWHYSRMDCLGVLMSSMFDQSYRDALGVTELPTGDWVMPIVYGRNIGKWLFRAVDKIHGDPLVTGYVNSEDDGWSAIESRHARTKAFWLEKVAWKDAGDRFVARLPQLSAQQEAIVYAGGEKLPMPEPSGPRNVLRKDGWHYTVRTFGIDQSNRDCKGFGGAYSAGSGWTTRIRRSTSRTTCSPKARSRLTSESCCRTTLNGWTASSPNRSG